MRNKEKATQVVVRRKMTSFWKRATAVKMTDTTRDTRLLHSTPPFYPLNFASRRKALGMHHTDSPLKERHYRNPDPKLSRRPCTPGPIHKPKSRRERLIWLRGSLRAPLRR